MPAACPSISLNDLSNKFIHGKEGAKHSHGQRRKTKNNTRIHVCTHKRKERKIDRKKERNTQGNVLKPYSTSCPKIGVSVEPLLPRP